MNKILLTTALVAAAGAAQAEVRPYIGVDYTRVMADYKDITPGVNADVFLEDNFDGVTPYVGVQLSKYVGVEASYLQTKGEKKSNFGVKTDTRISGYAMDVVGTLPVSADEKFALLGSLGAGRYEAKIKSNAAFFNDSDKDTAYRAGLGAQYQLSDNLGVRVMARYLDVDFKDTVDNVVTGNVGLNYRF